MEKENGEKNGEVKKTGEPSRARRVVRSIARWAIRSVLALLLVIVAYVAIGMLLSIIPVNSHPTEGGNVVIYLRTNGAHTDIVVPTRTDRIDWSKVAPPSDTAAGVQGSYLACGWGSQEFYFNVAEWEDLTCGVALRAISGIGGTALHTVYIDEPKEGPDYRRLVLTADQYDALVKYILASGKRNEAGAFIHIPHDGYGDTDAFYESIGRYSPIFTCNTWANSALKACGQKCCLWTALSGPIFKMYPLEDGSKGAAE